MKKICLFIFLGVMAGLMTISLMAVSHQTYEGNISDLSFDSLEEKRSSIPQTADGAFAAARTMGMKAFVHERIRIPVIPEATDEVAIEEESIPYVSPIGFEGLTKTNSDIYAWLEVPGTDVSYPILQHKDNDSYYHRRDINGKYKTAGSIYTEGSYNTTDFTDPVTVIYGHNMKDGSMFGSLQKSYSSAEDIARNAEIVIYLPDKELHYTVFAAVPYDDRHILYNYDFTSKRTFRLFFKEILSVRALEAVYAEDAGISSDDKALIMSTCLTGNSQNRFLVCGKLSYSVPEGSTPQDIE